MNDELLFRGSRIKAIVLFLGCAAFVAVGVLVAGQKPLIGWACIVFFGLGLPISALMLLPNSTHLRLTREGFQVKSPFGGKLIRWSDVERFRVVSIQGNKMIGFVYKPSHPSQQGLRRVSAAMTGVEGTVPNTYSASRDEVLKALTEWHDRHGRTGA